jgi:hypothetical protein
MTPRLKHLLYRTTAKYELSQISGADYDGADKQRKLSALDHAEAEGLNNIRSQGTSAAAAPVPAGGR